ncbi:MAG: type II toxin-antitoxin system RelE/ParE family toxin [Bacteroidales bacterium]|nr:type II toxin-antitoxin system RelE/ParE family toxin [Bacteroidales bacterium]
MEKRRQIIYFKNYFAVFFNAQTERVKDKIDYVLYLITVAERIPGKFFKYLEGTDGLFEIRVEFESNIFRIFCCFDEGNLVILFNGFQKKSQKIPWKEFDKAIRIKKEYFSEKNK